MEPEATPPAGSAPARRADFWSRVGRILAWSVLLGVALEGLTLGVRALGAGLPEWATMAAETVQKVSWSSIVCAALAAAQNVKRFLPATMGFVGLLVAPVSVVAARALHKGTLEALGRSTAAFQLGELLAPALLKAVEYALFGIWMARLARRDTADVKHYLGAGLAIGALGALALALWKRSSGSVLLVDTLNELCFPVGCAFVLALSSRAARAAARA